MTLTAIFTVLVDAADIFNGETDIGAISIDTSLYLSRISIHDVEHFLTSCNTIPFSLSFCLLK